MQASNRVFADKPAVRAATPLLMGLIGPSGSGKTFSALRLATGIQRVSGGEIYVIDTESRRALHYAEKFKFRHIEFAAPFGSLDYLAAIEYCVAQGAKTIVVDSMSHEHEGPGGVLEQHEQELDRMAGSDYAKRDRMTMLAWARPKAARRRMINTILQMNVNIIFCFRAKEKLKIAKGKEPEQLGFMPIAGEEFVYEMVLKCLLLPGAAGTPTWKSSFTGEQLMIKLPEQFVKLFGEPKQLDEDTGEQLARWAAGTAGPVGAVAAAMVGRYQSAVAPDAVGVLEEERKKLWAALPAQDKLALKAASDAAMARVAPAAESSETAPADAAVQA